MISIVSVSGGLGSAEALKRTIERRGKENVRAVFADVKGSAQSHFWAQFPNVDELLHERLGGETSDLYRFLWQLSYHFDLPIERLEDGRTIFTVFGQKRAFRLWVGAGLVHFCSEALKRQMIKRYIQSNFKPGEYEIVLGMGWDEGDRIQKSESYWRRELGWNVRLYSPLLDSPIADNCATQKWASDIGLEVSRSYAEQFEHDNCGGGCVSGGQAHFANLYNKRPDTYLYWAWMEKSLQAFWGKDVTILKDERGGITKPLSLYQFIERIKVGDYRKLDWGGCGCFVGQIQQRELFAEATP